MPWTSLPPYLVRKPTNLRLIRLWVQEQQQKKQGGLEAILGYQYRAEAEMQQKPKLDVVAWFSLTPDESSDEDD